MAPFISRFRASCLASFVVAFLIAVLPVAAAEAPVPIPSLLLSSSADPAKVRASYSGVNAQAEITSPVGIHVYLDVNRPALLKTTPGPDDLLCITHLHSDHRNSAFRKSFPGRVIDMAAGETLAGDVRILCIPSAHNAGDPIGPGVSSNYLFLIETGGLRILHTGDIGQLAYSEEQLKGFGGRVDLLFQQFDNSYSKMSLANGLGFSLLAQLGPRLVIPTHSSDAATLRLLGELPSLFGGDATVELSPSALPSKTSVLFLGSQAEEAWKLLGDQRTRRE